MHGSHFSAELDRLLTAGCWLLAFFNQQSEFSIQHFQDHERSSSQQPAASSCVPLRHIARLTTSAAGV
jgi:hypothetical protein